MKRYSIIDDATGDIISTNECSCSSQLPPEGPLASRPGQRVIHQEADADSERFEHGRIVPKGRQAKRKAEQEHGILQFRIARRERMEPYDFMFLADYPVPTDPAKLARYRAIQSARLATRELDYRAIGHEAALAELKRIWSEVNDLE